MSTALGSETPTSIDSRPSLSSVRSHLWSIEENSRPLASDRPSPTLRAAIAVAGALLIIGAARR
jgi:hypothetical protein